MSLALYRTYRPSRLSEVIGQEHVTEPLRRALESDRVHHAFLFSGPRGCGKTSTARILARSLLCEKGPTADPCGECRFCEALAPNGGGLVDVIELDAASHGGVDDTRELRERAAFVPALQRCFPSLADADVLAFQVARARHVMALPVLGYSRTVPRVRTSVPGLYLVSSARIVNGTTNVNETVALAERAALAFRDERFGDELPALA